MNKAIEVMLAKYSPSTLSDYERALTEIFQELALLGLWRSKFFEHAAFYGGTALRILHGLDRFSEDLHFSLMSPQADFNLNPHLEFIQRELSSWGFHVSITQKTKTFESRIESAFQKSDTRTQLLEIEVPEPIAQLIPKGKKLSIKVELDTDPPGAFSTTTPFLLKPIPFSVRTYTLESAFAGKMHAVLCRNWKNRVKGRDWYDFQWFVMHGIPCDLTHLSERMHQSGHLPDTVSLTPESFRALLDKRIDTVNLAAAKQDLVPFLTNPHTITAWSSDLFKHLADTCQTT
ncbi:nucleotidyl transferase AbiEii/AbiGii toxin family protein [Myxococcota bacterium]|nr:nucleotidyl transferase AbiEii/AbiGii toxin family protein [Myxococcota bacterium]MBU1537494.1 nucleotidyl transferase AbiEii/AbiGii toxin family protein [Myxococcota bacterium]